MANQTNAQWSARDQKVLWHPFTQMKDWLAEEQCIMKSADGFYLVDADGKRYIDGHSSLWVNVHGHGHPAIVEAIAQQAARLDHSTMLGLGSTPAVELAEKLVALTPDGLDRVFYSDSGSTSVEIALKMSFQYWRQVGQTRTKFITFSGAYHGDTIGSVSVGGMDLFHEIFQSLLFHTEQASFPYEYRDESNKDDRKACTERSLREVEHHLQQYAGDIVAVVAEPGVQGANGMMLADACFLPRLRELCTQYNVHLIVDEVATGFARTEQLFACDVAGISPDFMCLAKGLTGGVLPLAATLATAEIHSAFLGEIEEYKTFFHGHSFTGNPIACAAALANIELLATCDWLPQQQQRQEAYAAMLAPLDDHPNVGQVRRRGWMTGIELVADRESREIWPANEKIPQRVVEAAAQAGAVIRPLGNVMILMPPPAIDLPTLEELVSITQSAIDTVLQA